MSILNKKTFATIFAASMMIGAIGTTTFAADSKSNPEAGTGKVEKPDCMSMTDNTAKKACDNNQMAK